MIAVDSKYWLYANDIMVIFEGELKRSPNQTISPDHIQKRNMRLKVLSILIASGNNNGN